MYKKLVLIPIVVALGCGSKKEQTGQSSALSPAPEAVAPPAATAAGKPDDVLVQIGDEKLTRAEAEKEAEMRMRGMGGEQMPAEQRASVARQMLGGVVDQFVMRTLLLAEAGRQGVKATAEDEKKTMEDISTRLPPGKTIEDVMRESPMGEKRMRQELTEGITINKLFMTIASNHTVTVADEDIDKYAERNKDRLETAHARHILIGVADTDADDAKAAKRQQAEDIRKQLADGADFAAVAKQHSTCPSKDRGGDLGTFGRGQMVRPFEEAVFSQPTNAIGPVVETQFGYHIVQVLEREDVSRDKIRKNLEQQRQQAHFRTVVDELKAKAQITYHPSLEMSPAPASPPAGKAQ